MMNKHETFVINKIKMINFVNWITWKTLHFIKKLRENNDQKRIKVRFSWEVNKTVMEFNSKMADLRCLS